MTRITRWIRGIAPLPIEVLYLWDCSLFRYRFIAGSKALFASDIPFIYLLSFKVSKLTETFKRVCLFWAFLKINLKVKAT